ncbi:MAG: hypothetical protein GY754_08900 [bacterium]|nr:hypothetical protein [bacterium]
MKGKAQKPSRENKNRDYTFQKSPALWEELQPMGAQAKLTVASPNDVYEQEADRVAEQQLGL